MDGNGKVPVIGHIFMLLLGIYFINFIFLYKHLLYFVDVILYMALAIYFDNVIPTEYGTTKSPLFCFTASYWFPNSRRNFVTPEDMNDNQFIGEDIETIPGELKGKEGITIYNLKKSFSGFRKPTIHAVQGVSLKMYPGEITAILGHNGAGKTTLFNMLTGMVSTTSGTANIFGYDINGTGSYYNVPRYFCHSVWPS